MPDYIAVLRDIVDELSESLPDGTRLLCNDKAYYKPQPGIDHTTGEKKLMITLNARMQIVLGDFCSTKQERCDLLTQLFNPILPFKSSKEVSVAQAEAIWQMREQFDLLITQVRQPA